MSDTELLDFLEELNRQARYTGKCILRMSGTGRGWRLHETSQLDEGENPVSNTVRDAIEKFKNKTDKGKSDER